MRNFGVTRPSVIAFATLLFLNLSGKALSDPALGVVESGPDNGFLEALLSGGFATDPLFGGNGPTDLAC